MVVDYPFEQKNISDNVFIRTFAKESDSRDLIWHRDHKTREVQVISGQGWYLQLDDQLPIKMNVDEKYIIESKMYHRIIKVDGCTELKLKIKELP
jgi:hypothetical protein